MAEENKKFLTISHLKQLLSSLKQRFTAIENQLERKSNISDLATVATSGSYNDLTNKPSIPTVPANVSAFNNDTGYLTSHQSLNGYATENWVENQGYLTEHQDVSGKANTADLATVATSGSYNDLTNKPVIPTKTSDLTNDNGFVTQEGVKEQIISNDYIEEKVPYLYRETPYSVASVEEKIVGGSVVWNQLYDPSRVSAATKYGITSTPQSDGSILVSGTADGTNDIFFPVTKKMSFGDHVVFLAGTPNGGSLDTYSMYIRSNLHSAEIGNGVVFKQVTQDEVTYIRVKKTTPTLSNIIFKPILTDLTTMFGSHIADYIYSLEQSSAGAGVAKLKEWGFFTEDYYEYCEPTLKSVEGLVSKKTVGFNQWDEEWEVGDIDANSGENTNATTKWRSKNFIRIVPSTEYFAYSPTASNKTIRARFYSADKTYIGYTVIRGATYTDSTFVTPNNAYYMRFAPNNSGVPNYDICINFSDSAKNGTYKPYDGQTYPLDSSLTLRGIPKLDSSNNLYYDGDTYESDGTVSRRFTERAYQSGDESLEDAITDGATTMVKLATPTTETALPYHNPQIVGNTEEWVTTGIVPVGHNTKYYEGTMNLINSKADKSTTYTKTEVDTALSAKAGTSVATTSANGLMSSTDKSRLDDLYADYSSAMTALGVN